VGRILGKLEETGLGENTLVIYCSDHGEMAGEHGCWWKSNYYEGSVSVPLIASLPGVLPEGETSDVICNLMDLGPTGLDMAGGEPMPAVDGRSLWPVLLGEPNLEQHSETYSEHLGAMDAVPSCMIRRGPWKLYKYHDHSPVVLYNLKEDPNEMADLGMDSRYEAVRDDLLDRLYKRWNPADILKESALLDRDMRLLARWGKAVQLLNKDQLLVPDVEDVTLV
jgi:choline-sulfatase